NNLYTLFEQFDYPDPTMPTEHRNETIVAPQALLVMNDPLVIGSAEAFARQLIDETQSDAERIEIAYERAFGRRPTEVETRRALAFMDGKTDLRTLSMFCQSLFASSEFIYVR
ncbi:MAG: DUF1553 domain-containing protein, partial [Planctomycetaceae bacterium]